jgi:hypothetical protein
MRKNRLLLMGALAVALSIVGCNCDPVVEPGEDSGTPGETQDGGGTLPDGGGTLPDGGQQQDSGTVIPDGGIVGNQPDGGTSGVGLDGGPGSICVAAGAQCNRQQGAACCTGVCGVDGVCPQPNNLCRAAAETCTVGTDCCSNSCIGGKCSAMLCLDVGATCSGNEQCCSRTCTGGTCAPVPGGTCEVLGQACTTKAECCSSNCQNGVCTRAYVCNGYGDICSRNAECCGNACSVNDGGVGRCLNVTGGGGGGCTQDGNPCEGGTGCCSRTCVDLGYGATVCQPVGGCKLTGNFCTSNNACCGAISPSNVTCAGGRCDNGTSCNGTGNICGAGKLPDGGVLSINASQNCCDGQKEVCRVDSSGVPRCFGGGSVCPNGYDKNNPTCCIQTGNTCQFSDQCCSGTLCLPDSNGVLKCQGAGGGGGGTLPDGGSSGGGTCSAVGTRCDTDGGSPCCAGTECRATSELTKACQSLYTPPPPPPADGGTGTTDAGTGTTDAGTGGGTCSANDSACTTASQCCSGICSGNKCVAPAVCQPQNSVCVTNADCCSGLSCAVPQGTTVGSCQPGSTCSSSGQACSPTSPCCSGLSCRNSFGSSCDGTSACTCRVIIN